MDKRLTSRIVGGTFVVVSVLGVAAGVAGADPPSASVNTHNCAGVFVSGLAGPGFGTAVSMAAHEQIVDNFNVRNCGQANGNNP